MKYIVKTCYCKNKNGGPEQNELICENDGYFNSSDTCGIGEWCTGPDKEEYATNSRNLLCTKGVISLMHSYSLYIKYIVYYTEY